MKKFLLSILLGLTLVSTVAYTAYKFNWFGPKHFESVSDLSFSPDGKYVASSGEDGQIIIWEESSGLGRVLSDKAICVFSLDYSPDGRSLISESLYQDSGALVSREPLSGNVQVRTNKHTVQGGPIRFSPNSAMMAYVDTTLVVWDVITNRSKFNLRGHREMITSIDFNQGNDTLASASWGGSVILWNLDTGEERLRLKPILEDISSVVFSPNGNLLACASNPRISLDVFRAGNQKAPGHVRIWDVHTGSLISSFSGLSRVQAATFSPSGKTLAIAEINGTVVFRDTTTWTVSSTLAFNQRGVRALAYSPNGTAIAVGGEDGNVRIYRVSE